MQNLKKSLAFRTFVPSIVEHTSDHPNPLSGTANFVGYGASNGCLSAWAAGVCKQSNLPKSSIRVVPPGRRRDTQGQGEGRGCQWGDDR